MSETNVIAINFNGDKRLILMNSLSYKDVTKSGMFFHDFIKFIYICVNHFFCHWFQCLASEEFKVKNVKFYTNETEIEINEKIFPFYLKQHIVNPAFLLSMKAVPAVPAHNDNIPESESDDEMNAPILSHVEKKVQSPPTPQPIHVNVDSPSSSSSPQHFNINDFQPFTIVAPTTSMIGKREIKHVDDIRNISDANIDIIFNYYKQRKKLENKERILLCKTIIKHLLEVDPARV